MILEFGGIDRLAPDFFQDFELESLLRELEQQEETAGLRDTGEISEAADAYTEAFIASGGKSVLYWYGNQVLPFYILV